MKIYYAGASSIPKGHWQSKHLPLFSFNTEASALTRFYKQTKRKSFLDSGAYGALKKGSQIDIDEYINFVKANRQMIDIYATLDVIGDYKATNVNTDYIEQQGLNPLPVYHYGSPRKELDRLIERYDYIALGGLVALSLQQDRLIQWLDYCYAVIQDKIKIHGFGVTAYKLLQRYPFYSVDSTAWLRAIHYGRFVNYDGSSHDRRIKDYRTFELMNTRIYDEDGKKFPESRRIYYKVLGDSIKELDKRIQEITNIWTKRGVTWDG